MADQMTEVRRRTAKVIREIREDMASFPTRVLYRCSGAFYDFDKAKIELAKAECAAATCEPETATEALGQLAVFRHLLREYARAVATVDAAAWVKTDQAAVELSKAVPGVDLVEYVEGAKRGIASLIARYREHAENSLTLADILDDEQNPARTRH